MSAVLGLKCLNYLYCDIYEDYQIHVYACSGKMLSLKKVYKLGSRFDNCTFIQFSDTKNFVWP